MDVLKETDFKTLGKKKIGKVRDIYDQGDPSTGSGQARLILITTDRHSSFDRIIAHIPRKGQVLNQVSGFWFQVTADIIANHVIAIPDPNVTVAKKLKPVPMEAVMRGYLTGVTDTAIWTRYSKGQREFGDLKLSDGMKKNTKLSTPVFDPTTKEDTHDRAISPEQMIQEGLVTLELFEQVKETATKLFLRGQEIAAKQGLILVDTKYEFGTDEKGTLFLIDEIHTPDSSRYWQLAGYEGSMTSGTEPKSFDKEFLRLWFKEHCDPYKDAMLPEAPAELVQEMSNRYVQMYEQITGTKFERGATPVAERIEKNLKAYAV